MTRHHVATAVLATLAVACGPTVPGAETSPGDSIVPPASTASTPADDVVRIPVSGTAPGALVFAGSRAWVLAGEGGTLMEVDLVGRRELRSIEVGFGATHLAVLDGVVAVGRFDDSGNGSHLVLVDLRTEEIRGVPTRPLGGLAVGDDGIVWALEQAGRLLKVDVGAGEIVAELAVEIGANVHTEVQWGAGSAWVGSDGTPVLRVRGDGLAIEATIDVPSGLPFLFEAGLVWGAGPTVLWAIDPTTDAVVRQVTSGACSGSPCRPETSWLSSR
jgi:hypothetical protein